MSHKALRPSVEDSISSKEVNCQYKDKHTQRIPFNI